MRPVDRAKFAPPQVMVAVKGMRSKADEELLTMTAYIKKKIRQRNFANKANSVAKPKAKTKRTRSQKKPKPLFEVYADESVRARLNEMFHRKCGYCESPLSTTSSMEVEHYRPKAGLNGDSLHLGYWWLGMAWDNLLPSCIYCNQRRGQITPRASTPTVGFLEDEGRLTAFRSVITGKGTYFPILGPRVTDPTGDCTKEIPLLLNPCLDRPQDHLGFYIKKSNIIGLMLPKPDAGHGLFSSGFDPTSMKDFRAELTLTLKRKLDLRGSVSILVYGLNRLGLVQERTRVLRHLMFLECQVVDQSALIRRMEQRRSPPGYLADDMIILNGLYQLRDRLVQEMKALAKPQAPYSMMARAYLEDFHARLGL
ncbi:endonuclease [Pseudomonas orientalis]|uniref:endonuclease n=1 Tax=Pseudomonas orientalis TaxID=76758 RepID=UPI000F02D0D4